MDVSWKCRCVLFNIVFISVSAVKEGLGSVPIDANNKGVQSSLDFAVQSYNSFSKDDHLFKATRVLSAQVQDLGGLLYIMDVELGRTQCRKGADENLKSCSIAKTAGTSENVLCHFEVLSAFWRDERDLLQNHCNPVNK
ncbi:cystatin-like [Heterodontus francisci]|uniref:cystatin-like n=1 Tax=Heterodontus francisci TaxID=7792 RepID=UPI00355AFED0